jgi:hypothetical protein
MNWNDHSDIFIEFTTEIAPSPHPAIATWYDPPGGFLPINLRGVYDGVGAVVQP